MRVGMGYDVHKLVEGRKLIIGGVEIPHSLGLLGHSDADVLLHAIMDALLGGPKTEAAPAEEKAPAKRGRKPKAEKAEEAKPARKPRAKKADKAEK